MRMQARTPGTCRMIIPTQAGGVRADLLSFSAFAIRLRAFSKILQTVMHDTVHLCFCFCCAPHFFITKYQDLAQLLFHSANTKVTLKHRSTFNKSQLRQTRPTKTTARTKRNIPCKAWFSLGASCDQCVPVLVCVVRVPELMLIASARSQKASEIFLDHKTSSRLCREQVL